MKFDGTDLVLEAFANRVYDPYGVVGLVDLAMRIDQGIREAPSLVIGLEHRCVRPKQAGREEVPFLEPLFGKQDAVADLVVAVEDDIVDHCDLVQTDGDVHRACDRVKLHVEAFDVLKPGLRIEEIDDLVLELLGEHLADIRSKQTGQSPGLDVLKAFE